MKKLITILTSILFMATLSFANPHDIYLPNDNYIVDGGKLTLANGTANDIRIGENTLQELLTNNVQTINEKTGSVVITNDGDGIVIDENGGNITISNSGVTSVNMTIINEDEEEEDVSLTGNISLIGGEGITISPNGNNITIDADPIDIGVSSINGQSGIVSVINGDNVLVETTNKKLTISSTNTVTTVSPSLESGIEIATVTKSGINGSTTVYIPNTVSSFDNDSGYVTNVTWTSNNNLTMDALTKIGTITYNDTTNDVYVPTANQTTLTINTNGTKFTDFKAPNGENVTIDIPKSIGNLDNVSLSNQIVNHSILTYNANDNCWTNEKFPTIGAATITINTNGQKLDTFNANASTAKSINFYFPTNLAELSDVELASTLSNSQVLTYTNGSWANMNLPPAPDVNNGILTIQTNGQTYATFSANDSNSPTIDLPTKISTLKDVSLEDIEGNQLLFYDSGEWKNGDIDWDNESIDGQSILVGKIKVNDTENSIYIDHYVPYEEDADGEETAVTFGTRSRAPGAVVGVNSLAQGDDVVAGGYSSFASGKDVNALGDYSVAFGAGSSGTYDVSACEGNTLIKVDQQIIRHMDIGEYIYLYSDSSSYHPTAFNNNNNELTLDKRFFKHVSDYSDEFQMTFKQDNTEKGKFHFITGSTLSNLIVRSDEASMFSNISQFDRHYSVIFPKTTNTYKINGFEYIDSISVDHAVPEGPYQKFPTNYIFKYYTTAQMPAYLKYITCGDDNETLILENPDQIAELYTGLKMTLLHKTNPSYGDDWYLYDFEDPRPYEELGEYELSGFSRNCIYLNSEFSEKTDDTFTGNYEMWYRIDDYDSTYFNFISIQDENDDPTDRIIVENLDSLIHELDPDIFLELNYENGEGDTETYYVTNPGFEKNGLYLDREFYKNTATTGDRIIYNYGKASGEYSLVNGEGCIASGDNSHAEGYKTKATESTSHAEGFETLASAMGAHAEGYNAVASGVYSHAEGIDTVASGRYSHAEGSQTIASGECSFAAGYKSTASGNNSFALGSRWGAHAKDNYSFVWNGNFGIPYSSHGEGTFNISPDDGADGFYIGEYPLSWYIEHGSELPENLIYYGKDKQNQWTTITSGTRDSAFSSGVRSIVVGNTKTNGTSDLNGNIYIKPQNNTLMWTNEFLTVNYDGSSNPIEATWPNAYDKLHVGEILEISNYPWKIDTNTRSDTYGQIVQTAGSVKRDGFIKAITSANKVTIVLGVRPNGAVGDYSVSIGQSTLAMKDFSIALGGYSSAYAESSLAFGDNCFTYGTYSLANGKYNSTFGEASTAFGDNNVAGGKASFVGGRYSHALGDYSYAQGDHVVATESNSFAIGQYAQSTNEYAYVWNGMSYSDLTNRSADISLNDRALPRSQSTNEFKGLTNYYGSHGNGTFNINPIGGLAGFYVGEDPITEYLLEKPTSAGQLGQVLALGSDGKLTWTTVSGGGGGSGMNNPMSAVGDIIIGGVGGTPTALSVSTDGKVLTLDNGSPQWKDPTGGMSNPMTAAGDIIVGGSSGIPTKLEGGSDGYVLTMANGTPGWAPASGSTENCVTYSKDTNETYTAVAFNPGTVIPYSGDVLIEGTSIYRSSTDSTEITIDEDAYLVPFGGSVDVDDILEVVENGITYRYTIMEINSHGNESYDEWDIKIDRNFYKDVEDGDPYVSINFIDGETVVEADGNIATNMNSFAAGINAVATNDNSFVWNGNASEPVYASKKDGTFNVNPLGGTEGFYIGNIKMSDVLAGIPQYSVKTFYDVSLARIDTTTYVEQHYDFTNYLQSVTNRIVFEDYNDIEKAGYIKLYITEWYTTPDYTTCLYDIDNDDYIANYPSNKPWMTSRYNASKSVWEVEFRTVPGSRRWHYIGSKEYVIEGPRTIYWFQFEHGGPSTSYSSTGSFSNSFNGETVEYTLERVAIASGASDKKVDTKSIRLFATTSSGNSGYASLYNTSAFSQHAKKLSFKYGKYADDAERFSGSNTNYYSLKIYTSENGTDWTEYADLTENIRDLTDDLGDYETTFPTSTDVTYIKIEATNTQSSNNRRINIDEIKIYQ